jgi:predicted glycosyltransferase
MHDQVVRTELLARRGLLALLDVERATAADLAHLITTSLRQPPPQHSLRLDGAQWTTDWLCHRLGSPPRPSEALP